MSDPLHGPADGDADRLGTDGGIPERECPKCGESFAQLPRHMRACDDGDDA